jgi:ornithine cyclodeaminase
MMHAVDDSEQSIEAVTMRHIGAEAVRAGLPFEHLVPALRAMFAAGCEVPARHVHRWPDGQGGQVTSLLMPAWQLPPAGRYYGVKIINIAPGNAARGLPGLHASYLLHESASGRPLALIDGDELTARRTAAASALAASFLAREGARRLLIVGAGRIAAHLPQAYRAVRDIRQVSIWARRPEAARALAQRLQALGQQAQAVNDLPTAVAGADIISCATLATAPLIQGRWLKPGSHLDLIGSFTPEMREADDDCFRGALIGVDTDEALTKSGDLLGPLARGVIRAADVRATLAQLCRGERPGRGSPGERTVFKSVGTALEDLCAAALAYETAFG